MVGGAAVGPTEATTFMIREMKKGDKILVSWDWSLATGGNVGLKIQKGAILLAYKLLTDGPSRSLVRQDNYISVHTSATSSAGSTADPFSFNIFDENHYTDTGTLVHTSSASRGFNFQQADGIFKLTDYSDIKKGIYLAVLTSPLASKHATTSGLGIGWEIKVNGGRA